MGKLLRSGARLRYPITISKLLKRPGDKVNTQETILQYTFRWQREIEDSAGDTKIIDETGVADWDSPVEGTLENWKLKEGEVVTRDVPLASIDEVCSHDVQFYGLCAKCGKDMTEVNYATQQLDTDRANISMVHDNAALMISEQQANKAEMDLQRRLLKQRKLSLVVDLDQTIIHACIEPTVGEWQRDPNNPNYEAVKDVRSFQLDDGPRGLANGCWYYIKMRPRLVNFLQKVAEMYEMHIYTMGTRAYALNIAKIVDPTQKLFGNRVISRDENGSMTMKTLQRLFPVSTNMVVVIDDRADVWPRNRPNLIKVTPYDFFKGIGDINSSFLPKREDILAPSPAPPEPIKNGNEQPAEDPELAKKRAKDLAEKGDESALLQIQAQEQEKNLEKQLTERPLLHLQEQLDSESSQPPSENGTETVVEGSEESQLQPQPLPVQRHNLLRDDDQELLYLEQHLSSLHNAYFQQLDRSREVDELESSAIPDVGGVLDNLKSEVLQGATIVLSGLVPIGIDVLHSEIGIQATSFGAQVKKSVNDKITHLVISSSRPRTQKVRQAARIPGIKIVNQDWLAACLAQWEWLDETPYLVEIHPADRAGASIEPLDEPRELEKEITPSKDQPQLRIISQNESNLVNERGEDGDDESDAGMDDDSHSEEDEDDTTEGDNSPIEDLNSVDWGGVDDEWKEFMGDDGDTTDGESSVGGQLTDTESVTGSSAGRRKRKLKESQDGDGQTESEGEGGSVLAKKQRLAKTRTTGLRNVSNADEQSSSLPTPADTGAGDGEGEAEQNGENEDNEDAEAGASDDDLDADLEAELEAELEADAQQQQAEGHTEV